MKKPQWPRHLHRFSFILLGSLLLGWIIGRPLELAFAALLAYWVFHTIQLARFERWLSQTPTEPPPDLSGYLNVFIDHVYGYQRREQKALSTLRNLLSRAQNSANSLADGYLTIDRHDRLEWWNTAATHFLGLKYPRDIGQPLVQLLRDPGFIRYFQSGNFEQRVRVCNPANPRKHMELQLTRYGNDEKLLHIRDITPLMHLEQVRTDFIANISHELRTPLTVLKGYVEMLDDFTEQLPESMSQGLRTMRAQVHRMQNLIDDLFTLTRLEDPTAQNQQEIINIQALLHGITEEAIMLAREKNIHIALCNKEHFDLQGASTQLRSAIMNLVSNAVHYTNPNGAITIRTTRTNNGAEISITDNGIGIDPAHIPRLTERFYRVDPSRSTATGGTGLGLAIVKHVLLRHEASLTVNSQLKVGSTFTCHFPKHRVVLPETLDAKRTMQNSLCEHDLCEDSL
ncbi:MAG: phosphate regulon sensor histidine kinase PhoR [Gammaproteobacteria bacterium]